MVLQRTEVVDDASWVMGFLDIFDPAIDSIKRLLNLDQNKDSNEEILRRLEGEIDASTASPSQIIDRSNLLNDGNGVLQRSEFDLDAFIIDKLVLDPSKLDAQLIVSEPHKIKSSRRLWRPERKSVVAQP